ncbi:MAG: DUF1330 domain-containing protein [Deltaproteobacteria bacterium]|nr:DUF1330 domain-containing protein [Deltaproteobacteria bacterium]
MSTAPTPAYALVQLKVKNPEEDMQRYGKFVIAMFEQIGAQVVALSPTPTVVEGSWSGNWTVVIRFPSMAVAEAWYNSPEYQPLKDLRINELTEGGSAGVR